MPEQAGHREPPDVGVEHPDGQAPAGQGHGQVDGDRALAHPALARGDGDDPGGVGDVGGRRRVLGQQPGPGHDRLALLGVHHPGGDRHRPRRRGGRRRGSRRRCWIWVRSGQPATVRATSTADRAAVDPMSTPVTMPSSTMSAPSSGSTTPRSAARTASSEGTGAPACHGPSSGVGLTWSPRQFYRARTPPATRWDVPPGRRRGYAWSEAASRSPGRSGAVRIGAVGRGRCQRRSRRVDIEEERR